MNEVTEINFPAAADVTAAAAKGPRRFSMNAYNGGAMSINGFNVPIVVDLAGLSVGKSSRPILFNHQFEDVVGHTEKIDNDRRKLTAVGVVSGTGPRATEIVAAADNGFPWKASIGARMVKQEIVRQGASVVVNGQAISGPAIIARQSVLGEISFVAIGADDTTSATIASRANMNNPTPAAERGHSVTFDQQTAIAATADTGGADDNDPVAAERARVSAIARASAKYIAAGADPATFATIHAKAVDEGWDENKAELEMLRASRPQTMRHLATGGTTRAVPNGDPFAVIEASLCLSMGLGEEFVGAQYDEKVVDAATTAQFRDCGIHGLFRQIIRAAGHTPPDRFNIDTIKMAFEADRMIRANGFSTVSLPGLLGNVANKTILNSYNAVATTWRLIAAVESNSDFKQYSRYRLTAIGTYDEVPPGGKIDHATLSEESYTSQLKTYGRMLALDRQMIINDDLSAFASAPKLLGRMSGIAVEKLVFRTLLANVATFFTAGHANYLAGATPASDDTRLNIEGLTRAETLFLQQTDDNGDPTMIVPRVLLVPSALNATGSALMTSTEIRDTTASTVFVTGNPHAGRFTAASSPWLANANLTGYSATAWYLFADPNDVAAMEVAFLNGQQTPTVETAEADFDTLGIQMRSYHDFGVAMRDYRAAVRMKGAA